MDLGFKGKVALVTGAGIQTGFGKAISPMLAKGDSDIANTVAFLASDASGDIVGQVICVDGVDYHAVI